MSYMAEVDMTTVDCFRENCSVEPQRHWLLDSVWGRNMLKAHLRVKEPHLNVPKWRELPELDEHLESCVDDLGLREWSEPKTAGDIFRYVRTVVQLEEAITNGKSALQRELLKQIQA